MGKDFLGKYKNWYLIILLFVVFILRIPSWFEPYWYGDEGITLTMGQAWRAGMVIYRDIHDNKPPLLYLVAAIANNLFWFKIILTGWVLFTIWLFWKLTWKINQLLNLPLMASIISILIFSLLITLPTWEGNLVNGEIFFLAPIISAIYLIITKLDFKQTRFRKFHISNLKSLIFNLSSPEQVHSRWLILSGVLFSMAFLFKHPAAADFTAVIIFLLFLINFKQKNHFRFVIYQLLYIIIGFAVPLIIVSFLFLLWGGFQDFVKDVFLNNLIYVSVWAPKARWGSTTAFGGTVIQRLLITVAISILLWLKRQHINKTTILVMLWFTWSLFGALLSGRPYPHYLLQVTPSLSIIGGWFLISLINIKPQATPQQTRYFKLLGLSVYALLLLFLGWARIGFRHYSIADYYANFIQYISGARSTEEYYLHFDPRVPSTYRVAAWIKSRTRPEQTLFVLSDDPLIYPLSQKLPPTSYIAAYHIDQYHLQNKALSQLKQNPPDLIIKQTPVSNTFPELNDLLRQHYLWVKNIDDYQIYQIR